MIDIITQYTGSARRSPENLSGDGDHMQIIVSDNGKETVIFTGKLFDQRIFSNACPGCGHKTYENEVICMCCGKSL